MLLPMLLPTPPGSQAACAHARPSEPSEPSELVALVRQCPQPWSPPRSGPRGPGQLLLHGTLADGGLLLLLGLGQLLRDVLLRDRRDRLHAEIDEIDFATSDRVLRQVATLGDAGLLSLRL